LPESDVTTLYRGGAKGFKLLKDGVSALENIPYDFSLTNNQEIQRQAARTGKPHVDKPAIASFLNRIKYPVSFMDFETFGTAILLFDGLRPYQQVPFQFSLHVQRSRGSELEHHKFLAEGLNDPRLEFMRQLRDAVPEKGSVVAFNAPFELARLKECADLLLEYQPWLMDVRRRIVDLLVPFRGFRYYHPKQNGSASMKAVLPALTGLGYDQLAIQDGGMASLEFLRVTLMDVSDDERRHVRRDLAGTQYHAIRQPTRGTAQTEHAGEEGALVLWTSGHRQDAHHPLPGQPDAGPHDPAYHSGAGGFAR
jgi:hypothetical protein